MSEGFCTKCGFVIESFEGLSGCPSCKTKSLPCGNKDQVSVSINIHELRILCIWAERWVGTFKDEQQQAESAQVLRSIAGRLLKQLPAKTRLLLSDEIKDLKASGYKVQTDILEI